MAAIGSLLFCTACGNLLPPSTTPDSDQDPSTLIPCDLCGTQNRDTSAKTRTSRSKPSAFPSALRAKRSAVPTQTLKHADMNTWSTIREACPECGRAEVRYQARQIRSADEGTTVFYECDGCGFRWNTDN